MDLGKAERKDNKQRTVVMKKEDKDRDEDRGDEQMMMMGCFEDDNNSRKKKGVVLGSKKSSPSSRGVQVVVNNSSSCSSTTKCCQAEKCTADLSYAKQYHRRHKVCEHHSKAQVVLVSGLRQRFCQQCSRFHELSEFDETRRSCRRRLAGHNERRRKSSTETHAEGSGRKGTGTQLKDVVCGQADDRGRMQIAVQENATYKHFHIR
ncbi:hypothetical protein TIFTF001_045378 [Ficus carica]|uniref:SBP-type domain-containing protein n=1 Tax=Ficus carica TaxID=3494 RepID=A0AA87YSD4_FICCA|nr:hypothetical protein TIFTF001_045378 [Ficus carica]